MELVKCYNCGKELSKKEITHEHIPARNLFNGYDDEYKTNRITVPACFECNNKYSQTDEEFRNMIGVIAKRKENNDITSQSVKSILRKDSDFNRLCFDSSDNIVGVEFDQQLIEEFHKKNFKGLFYHQYGKPLSNEYELAVIINEKDFKKIVLGIFGYLKEFFEWKYSGHKDILSYCIQPLILNLKNPEKKDLTLQDDVRIIVGAMVYNKEHVALVFAKRKSNYNTK